MKLYSPTRGQGLKGENGSDLGTLFEASSTPSPIMTNLNPLKQCEDPKHPAYGHKKTVHLYVREPELPRVQLDDLCTASWCWSGFRPSRDGSNLDRSYSPRQQNGFPPRCAVENL